MYWLRPKKSEKCVFGNDCLEFALNSLTACDPLYERDVRIYPLQVPNVTEHLYLPRAMNDLHSEGFVCERVPVKQRDIIGAEKMLLNEVMINVG